MVWQQPAEYRSLEFKQGLDLRGGTQVLLQAKPTAGQSVTTADMEAAKVIVDRRVNGLGVTEPLVQIQGENRIIVELPGVDNPDQAVQTLKNTGQLEFVEIGSSTDSTFANIQQGSYVRTSNNDRTPDQGRTRQDSSSRMRIKVFKTIMTGRELKNAAIAARSVWRAIDQLRVDRRRGQDVRRLHPSARRRYPGDRAG